jgi:hypothetical protein
MLSPFINATMMNAWSQGMMEDFTQAENFFGVCEKGYPVVRRAMPGNGNAPPATVFTFIAKSPPQPGDTGSTLTEGKLFVVSHPTGFLLLSGSVTQFSNPALGT